MKGAILLKVLERLVEGVGEFTDLFAAMVEAGYGASPTRMEYVLRENRRLAARSREKTEREMRAMRRYRVLLSSLKRDGLIEEHVSKFGRAFTVTKKGIAKLSALRKKITKKFPSVRYERETSDTVTIVTFDVPEKERRKRDWLRAVLKNLKFTMVHKSVWMGKVAIPRAFLADIKRLRLAEFVEIFQVTKTGSLRHIA
ncbi:MAG: hypothetical protein FJ088_06620 [Deltaproteobacteria bacterium]|nr:hypothetical protein [Deltaproteobacteria bacterium]